MSNNLGDMFRARAKEYRDAANSVLEAPGFGTDPKILVTVIVGHVHANTLECIADLSEYLRSADQLDANALRRRAILEKNNAIRQAAARGDWAAFDRLTSEPLFPGDGGGGSSSSGQGGTG